MIASVAEAVRYWLRREIAAAGLEGTLVPRIVNPRAQGFLAGFVGAVASELGLDAAQRYELEARVYVSLFEGTPMGEQLGLEALQMAKHLEAVPNAKSMLAGWADHAAIGAEAGRHFVGWQRGLAAFGATFV